MSKFGLNASEAIDVESDSSDLAQFVNFGVGALGVDVDGIDVNNLEISRFERVYRDVATNLDRHSRRN